MQMSYPRIQYQTQAPDWILPSSSYSGDEFDFRCQESLLYKSPTFSCSDPSDGRVDGLPGINLSTREWRRGSMQRFYCIGCNNGIHHRTMPDLHPTNLMVRMPVSRCQP